MKRITNLIIIIVSLALAGALTFSIFTVAKNIEKANSDNGSDEFVGDENTGGAGNVDPDAETWTLEDGEIDFFYNRHNEGLSYMKLAKSGLEPGRYNITWSFKSTVLDTGAQFLSVKNADNGAQGYGFYHNKFVGLTPSGALMDESTLVFYVPTESKMLTQSYTFDVEENGEFAIFVLKAENTSSNEAAAALRDLIKTEHINRVVLTKVG